MLNISSNTVAICMATFNGSRFLDQQIKSILLQTYDDWVLFIRDDQSTDCTKDIIKHYATLLSEKIIIIEDKNLQGGNAKNNFSTIIKWVNEHYSFNYFMFADQDDYWLETKIEDTINAIKEFEKGKSEPVLVHSDLKVVDQDLNVLGESFMKYRALKPEIKDCNHLLVQNNITGCTMGWNAKLNQLFDLSNEDIVMHDWWIALVASCFGHIIYLNKPTILYRQHSKNVVGATKVNSLSFIFKRLSGHAHVKDTLNLAIIQAKAFFDYYDAKLSLKQKEDIIQFIHLKKSNKIQKIVTIFRHRFLKQGMVQIIGEIMYI